MSQAYAWQIAKLDINIPSTILVEAPQKRKPKHPHISVISAVQHVSIRNPENRILH
jgi:hypothetical protein